jgi:hypothetical protein
MRALRILPLLGALFVCAWFALGIRQAHDTQQAMTIVGVQPHASAAQARRVNSLLSAAGLLNPDQEVNVLRGQIALERGDARRARAILLAVTRREPRDLQGWLWLLHAAGGLQPYFNEAGTHLRELDPLLQSG